MCALFARGVTVALRPLDRMPCEVPVVVKLVVHPTAVLMAALPPALSVFILPRQYDVWVRPASGAVLLGTLFSVVTLTTVMWLAKTQQLPTDLFR